MPAHRSSRLVNALAILAGCALVYMILDATGRPAPAQNFRSDVTVTKPRPFTVARESGFIRLQQAGYRQIHFRETALTSFVHYEPGEGLAEQFDHPVIMLKIAGHEYRLDFVDQAQAKLFLAFILDPEAAQTDKAERALKAAAKTGKPREALKDAER